MSKFVKFGAIAAATLITASAVSPLTATHVSADSKDKTVTVGVVGNDDSKIWKSVAKTAKDKYGVTVKTKVFTDYNQPNKAVADGSIDLNAFQHQFFLDDWNKHNKNQVKAIGDTFITPIRLYATDYKEPKNFKKGDTIGVPNDPTNEGRSLKVLESAGLIKLKKTDLPTTKDITENKKDLKIKELSADQVAAAFKKKSVDGAVINTNYAQEAKIKLDSAIYVEPENKDSKQWVNVIAAKKDKTDKKEYKDVVKAYQTEQTKKVMKEEFGDTQDAAWDKKF
ncbi:MetQ/NlpA family ABC transporter substrate-binding protein [Weissella minor]|uniref:Lipoprotein n=1 Tax=Weissella minor TaxID=1620 RepID=A0A0R2JNS3_9LACO|nr:MetQ/NlpA family ABC transporter substrate-binding protein [Weissella minor]KRN76138.1 abc superfamily atp binding cassette transporter, binding protein [Weissella minor]MBS0949010.1 MetQ/NlpA family ABC transporter substrate-binding protein [Weissella minor]